MSDNGGPYAQPPQYPGGEGNSGGQPGYGGAYGPGGGQPGPGTGGQPSYPSGPYQGPYGDPGTGGQQPPGYGPGPGPYPGQGGPQFQQPHEQQQMFHQGGQPPYPPAGYPPQQHPQQPRRSNAGLWIVISGGVVIAVLIVAVIVVLFTGDDDPPPAAQPDQQQEAEQQQDEGEQGQAGGDGSETEQSDDSDGAANVSGEPPYAPPEDPCAVLSEDTLSQTGADSASKTITDNSATCSWSTEVDGIYGTLRVNYQTPYGGADSVEAAKDDYAFEYDYATDEEGSVFDLKVVEEQNLDYGDESVLVFAEEEIVSVGNRTTVLIRQDNITIKVEWSSSNFGGSEPPQTLSDVESLMKQAGREALEAL